MFHLAKLLQFKISGGFLKATVKLVKQFGLHIIQKTISQSCTTSSLCRIWLRERERKIKKEVHLSLYVEHLCVYPPVTF